MTLRSSRADWLTVPALLALALVPIVASVVRVWSLAGGAQGQAAAADARFFDSPLPVLLHVICASLFTALGAFQFAASFRMRHPRWHRLAGRVLVACGLLAGTSGLWMTVRYPRVAGDSDLLDAFRLLFGAAMVVSLLLGVRAILRRDRAGHRAWMIRGYAIALGAGTQAVVSVPWFLLVGEAGPLARALLLGGAWVLNAAVAEAILRRTGPDAGRRSADGRNLIRPGEGVLS